MMVKSFVELGTIFVEVPEPSKHGYPEKSWLAIKGVPPTQKVFSSTHLTEALLGYAGSDVVAKLGILSEQEGGVRSLFKAKAVPQEVIDKAKEKLKEVVG